MQPCRSRAWSPSSFFLCCATAARADAVDDALAKFLDDKFASTEQAVSELAASGAANAPAILDALGDNRLLIDPVAHVLVYQTTGGDVINAKTGEKLAGVDVDSFKKVRVNNALRSAIEAALGALTLANPDPQKRAAPAEAVFKSRDAKALPALEAQLAKESDPRVAEALRQARAAIVVARSEGADAPIASPPIATLEGARRPGRAEPDRRGRGQDRRSRGQDRRARRGRGDQGASRLAGTSCRTSRTASRPPRCCCSPRSASPSPSA